MSPVRRFALELSSIPLALDELADVPGDLREKQTHRDVGQRDREGERDGQGGEQNDQSE
jgi:hypothetical protein